MTHCEYTLSVCLTRDGQVIGRREVGAGAAVEDAVFRALLAGHVSNGGDAPEVRVEPEWSTTGPPRVAALRVSVADGERRYGAAMFREQAGAIARELSAGGKLGREEPACWSLRAERRETHERRRATVRRAPLPLIARPLPAVEPGEMDVAIAESVLAELRAHMETRPAEEVAGLLTGRLVHDRERGAACLEVSGYHPLRAGAGGTSRLHFALDAGSFVAARRELRDLPAGEVCCGWAHDHLACTACPTVDDCRAHTIFFSTDDYLVHRGAFPAPFQIAVVAGKVAQCTAREPAFEVYGWREGSITSREFELQDGMYRRVRCALLPGDVPSRPLDVSRHAEAAVRGTRADRAKRPRSEAGVTAASAADFDHAAFAAALDSEMSAEDLVSEEADER